MSHQNHGNFVQGYMNPLPEPVTDEDIFLVHSQDTIEISDESYDILTGETSAQMIARDQANDRDRFFQPIGRDELMGFLIVVPVFVWLIWKAWKGWKP